MKKIFLLNMILFFVSTERLCSEENNNSYTSIKFKMQSETTTLYGGVGTSYGYGTGYEAFIEYPYSENVSIYLTGSLFQDIKEDDDTTGKVLELGDIRMIGIQCNVLYFYLGYHLVSQHSKGKDILVESSQALSLGLATSGKSWEIGAIFYYLDGEIRGTRTDITTGGVFIRKKFSL